LSERKKYIEENKIKTNYTTIFLLPMIGYDRLFYSDELISAYIIDDDKPKLAIVFENSDTVELQRCIEILGRNREFISMDYDDDNKEVVLIMNIPKYYMIDYNMFIIGRYSKFSNAYKELLLDVHGRKTGNGECIMMVDALHPDLKARKYKADKMGCNPDDLPNGEVMSVPTISEEQYNKANQLKQVEEQ